MRIEHWTSKFKLIEVQDRRIDAGLATNLSQTLVFWLNNVLKMVFL
jgi:hypothetical protein